MPNNDILYFAYGSNLDPSRKEERTEQIREARVARLIGYRLAFNKRANNNGVYANIIRQPGAEVWGVLYCCTPKAMDRLDVCEGVSGGHYERKPVEVENDNDGLIQAITYIACAKFICAEGRPTERY